MNRLRVAVFLCLLIFSALLFFLLYLLVFLFLGEKQRYQFATSWGRLIVNPLINRVLGIRFRVTGQENFPDKPCVIFSKHQSALDIFVLLLVCPYQTWVLKKELMMIPFFGWVLATIKPIAIDRKQKLDALNRIISQGKVKIKQGYSIIIYPEGTRVKLGVTLKYKKGGAALAKACDVDVLPVALNTGCFWNRSGLVKTGTVDVWIGDLITTSDKSEVAILDEAKAVIESKCSELLTNVK